MRSAVRAAYAVAGSVAGVARALLDHRAVAPSLALFALVALMREILTRARSMVALVDPAPSTVRTRSLTAAAAGAKAPPAPAAPASTTSSESSERKARGKRGGRGRSRANGSAAAAAGQDKVRA